MSGRNEGQTVSGGGGGGGGVSHVWNYPEESGLTRCSAAASWWHEGKETKKRKEKKFTSSQSSTSALGSLKRFIIHSSINECLMFMVSTLLNVYFHSTWNTVL